MVVADLLRIAADGFAGDLEHAGAGAADRVDDGAYFVPGSESACDGLVVGCLVVRRARSGEAEGAGAYGLLGDARHALDLVLGSLFLEGPLTHDVGAQRRVAHVTRVVDALRHAVEYVEVLRIGLPTPCDAGQHGFASDVLGALEIAEYEVGLGLPAGREGEAAIAHHHAGDAVVARAGADGVPEHLGIHVRMAVDEARCDNVALGVDGLPCLVRDATDRRDVAVLDPDIGGKAWCPRAVYYGAVFDDQVVSHCSPPRRNPSTVTRTIQHPLCFGCLE